jgi:hypothetical protein
MTGVAAPCFPSGWAPRSLLFIGLLRGPVGNRRRDHKGRQQGRFLGPKQDRRCGLPLADSLSLIQTPGGAERVDPNRHRSTLERGGR